MKKLFISLLAIAATVNAMAMDYTAKAKLTLTSANATCAIIVGETNDALASFNCATINMDNRLNALYSIVGAKNYQNYYAADVEGTALGLKTDAATEYTINFSGVIGKLYLVDAVANKTTEITEGGSYAFTAEANQTIADRFSITKVAPLPDYLFVDGIVTIGELKDGETIYFQYFTYAAGKRVNGIAGDTNRNKSFEPYTTEGYCEIWYTNKAGVERKFIVNPAPIVTPAN